MFHKSTVSAAGFLCQPFFRTVSGCWSSLQNKERLIYLQDCRSFPEVKNGCKVTPAIFPPVSKAQWWSTKYTEQAWRSKGYSNNFTSISQRKATRFTTRSLRKPALIWIPSCAVVRLSYCKNLKSTSMPTPAICFTNWAAEQWPMKTSDMNKPGLLPTAGSYKSRTPNPWVHCSSLWKWCFSVKAVVRQARASSAAPQGAMGSCL